MISDNLIVASSISAVDAESEDYISTTFGDKYIEKKKSNSLKPVRLFHQLLSRFICQVMVPFIYAA